MSQTVLPPDIEGFLTSYLHDALGIEVDVKEPSGWDGSTQLIVVRDDGGAMTGPSSFEHTLGVTVHAGTRQDVAEGGRLARLCHGLLSSDEVVTAEGSPIAAVERDGFNGPYRITERQDTSTWYLTAAYIAVGEVTEL